MDATRRFIGCSSRMSKALSGRFLERLWYGPASGIALLLIPLAWLYGLVAACRRLLFRSGLLSSGHPGVPVIVVGNITAGGTGKTPVVAWLAEQLRAAGWHPGIASRGYGAAGAARHPMRVLAATPAKEAGDEPVLLARRTGMPVVVCVDRLAAARALVAAGADVIIADDGLQHYRLARDMEIAVVDGIRRFGNGRLLPAGPLREPQARLARIPVVLVNSGDAAPGWHAFSLRPGDAVRLTDGSRRPLAAFAGGKAWAVAGIGNPARFHASLTGLGIDVAEVHVADHGLTDLNRLREEAHWPILMTEKDAVKYPCCADPETWYVPVELDMAPAAVADVMSRIRKILEQRT